SQQPDLVCDPDERRRVPEDIVVARLVVSEAQPGDPVRHEHDAVATVSQHARDAMEVVAPRAERRVPHRLAISVLATLAELPRRPGRRPRSPEERCGESTAEDLLALRMPTRLQELGD